MSWFEALILGIVQGLTDRVHLKFKQTTEYPIDFLP